MFCGLRYVKLSRAIFKKKTILCSPNIEFSSHCYNLLESRTPGNNTV
uniref:Uncharacterized protein n=1 Tax=Anguilla anguilla TaxID=7936 RepID=A0A0E9PUT3_ANGAN